MKKIMGLLLMLGLMVSFGGCGKDTPTGASEEITKGPEGQTLEVKTEEWDNGNIKVEFQYYRDGGAVIKHGYYKEYREDGQIKSEGTYKEDKLEIEKRFKYYQHGKEPLRLEENYKDGEKDGKWVEYHYNGRIKEERNYKDGKADGQFVYYDTEGNITSELCYIIGEVHKGSCPDDD